MSRVVLSLLQYFFNTFASLKLENGLKRHVPSITKKMNYELIISLRKNCPYSEFSWSIFAAFGLNIDQKNSKYGHFSRSAMVEIVITTCHSIMETFNLIPGIVLKICRYDHETIAVAIIVPWFHKVTFNHLKQDVSKSVHTSVITHRIAL